MSDTKTPPIVGDMVIENFKKDFFEKYTEESGQITGLQFWPAKLIEETYRKAAAAIGEENETHALKTFYSEMVHFLRTSTYIDFDTAEEDELSAVFFKDNDQEVQHMAGTIGKREFKSQQATARGGGFSSYTKSIFGGYNELHRA